MRVIKEYKNTNPNIDDRYILDQELSTDKPKGYLDKKLIIFLWLIEEQANLKML
jgi:hypothetical protein